MNTNIFEHALLLRLLVEGGYGLLIDADENTAKFPEEETWNLKFEQGETESLEKEYLDSVEAYYERLPVVGESLDSAVYKLNGKVVWEPKKNVCPALLPLKHYASRILVKMTPLSTQIMLFSKSNQPLPERELMTQVCNDVRRAVLSAYGVEGSRMHVVSLSTILVGSFGDEQRRWAKTHTNRVSLDKNFFRYLCVEPENERVWTPTKIHTLTDRRIIKKVFSSSDNSVESLFVHDKSKVFSWWRIVFSGCLAFILTTIGYTFSKTDLPILSPLIHAFVPMVVFTVVFATMKNREKAYQQVKFGVSIHVALTVALFM